MESIDGRKSDWSVSLSSGGVLNIADATLVQQQSGGLSFTRREYHPGEVDREVSYVAAGHWEVVVDRKKSNIVLIRVGK